MNARDMSLRDYFAAQAMIGYMAGGMTPENSDLSKPVIITTELIAQRAYQYADAMIRQCDAAHGEHKEEK